MFFNKYNFVKTVNHHDKPVFCFLFLSAQIITAELLKEEETEIIQAVKRSPSFVVFGQNPYAKSRIVNELFGRPVLPLFEHGAGRNDDIVMVRFKQSHHASAGTLQDLEHVGSLQTDQNDWTPLQAEDLIVPAQAKGDVESSTLEVVQDHPLLRFGAQVTVAPSRAGGLTEKLVKACVNHTPCVLLYGFATDQLHDKVSVLVECCWYVCGASVIVCVCMVGLLSLVSVSLLVCVVMLVSQLVCVVVFVW